MSVDPLFEKYPDMGAYGYCGGNPVVMVDPDGSRVWFVLYTDDGDNGIFSLAAKTRENEIHKRMDFNKENDHIYLIKYTDLAKLKDLVKSSIDDANNRGYGKTVEVASYSHQGSGDGPIGNELTSGSHSA